MKTLLKLHGLWETVEKGATGTDVDNAKKDARAVCLIQQGVNDVIFPKIATASNAKEPWDNLATSFEGSTRVKIMKLQGLRGEFETLQMSADESIQTFLTQVQNIVNQRRVLGDEVTEEMIVTKVLRSLTQSFDHVVSAIEESKDLANYTFVELTGSLQTHKARLKKREVGSDEKAFYAWGNFGRGRGRTSNNFLGGRRGRGFNFRGGRNSGDSGSMSGINTDSSDYDSSEDYKKKVECFNCNQLGHYRIECPEAGKRCYYCNKLGHIQLHCRIKQREEDQARFAQDTDKEHEGEDDALFMAFTDQTEDAATVWFLDSGCSNHMCGHRNQFTERMCFESSLCS